MIDLPAIVAFNAAAIMLLIIIMINAHTFILLDELHSNAKVFRFGGDEFLFHRIFSI